MITRIEGAVAICRRKSGLIAQLDCYTYKGKLYVKVCSGFARVSDRFGDDWLTTNIDTKVIEFSGVKPEDYKQ